MVSAHVVTLWQTPKLDPTNQSMKGRMWTFSNSGVESQLAKISVSVLAVLIAVWTVLCQSVRLILWSPLYLLIFFNSAVVSCGSFKFKICDIYILSHLVHYSLNVGLVSRFSGSSRHQSKACWLGSLHLQVDVIHLCQRVKSSSRQLCQATFSKVKVCQSHAMYLHHLATVEQPYSFGIGSVGRVPWTQYFHVFFVELAVFLMWNVRKRGNGFCHCGSLAKAAPLRKQPIFDQHKVQIRKLI